MTSLRLAVFLVFALVLNVSFALAQGAGCAPEELISGPCSWLPTSFNQAALNDLAGHLYLNQYPGGLYGADYGNSDPNGHVNDGITAAGRVQPLDINGNPSSTGSIIFLSIGMSNCTIDFCGGNVFFYGIAGQPCATTCPNPTTGGQLGYNETFSFMAQAYASNINPRVVLFDGAAGNQGLERWDPYTLPLPKCDYESQPDAWCNYVRVAGLLQNNGYSEAQVQVGG